MASQLCYPVSNASIDHRRLIRVDSYIFGLNSTLSTDSHHLAEDNNTASCKLPDASWIPNGIPEADNPLGIVIAGNPQ